MLIIACLSSAVGNTSASSIPPKPCPSTSLQHHTILRRRRPPPPPSTTPTRTKAAPMGRSRTSTTMSTLTPLALLLLACSAGAFMLPPRTAYSTRVHSSKSVRRPTPSRISQTENFRDAKELSRKFVDDYQHLHQNNGGEKKRVAIFGGGLSGLACAKYVSLVILCRQ